MDTIFRANVSQVQHLCTKNGLPEFIRGFRGFLGFPGNGPNRAGPAPGSTRAGGKDGGSLYKPQTVLRDIYHSETQAKQQVASSNAVKRNDFEHFFLQDALEPSISTPASKMSPRCLSDAPQMLPRCLPDACFPDASKMPARCLPDASQMPHR